MIDEPNWAHHVICYSATGSRVVCDSVPEGTDYD